MLNIDEQHFINSVCYYEYESDYHRDKLCMTKMTIQGKRQIEINWWYRRTKIEGKWVPRVR